MKTALRIGLMLLVMVGVGLLLGRGLFGGLSQDNRDADNFNDLRVELNALQTGPESQDASGKADAMGAISQQFQSGTMGKKDFEAQFRAAGHAFCASLRTYVEKEVVILQKPEWPDRMEEERRAVAAFDAREIKKLQACEKAPSAKAVAKTITELDAMTSEGAKLTQALNDKAASIVK